MLEINNQYTIFKRRIDTEVLKAFFNGTLEEEVDKIPIKLVPKNKKTNRCCIYKERAMVRYRIMEFLGINIKKYDDEYKSLKEYVKEILKEDPEKMPVLTTIEAACYGCPPEQYRISDACRGCFARPCTTNCPRDAIVFIDGKAHILEDKCIKCGKCFGVCPYHAVLHLPVPCESACPVGAVHKNEDGVAEIDHTKCISCGKCTMSCPFGAIAERSGIMPVAKMLKKGVKTVAMIAPSIEGQFAGTLSQIKSALLKLGFTDVVEVAKGAEVTSATEAKELKEKMDKKEGYMTTSCCPAYMNLINKHLTFLSNIHSTARTPMGYTAEMCRKTHKGYKNIFIGPCLAKRTEATWTPEVDGVINYSELAALFLAKGIDVMSEEKASLGDTDSFKDCRNFALTGGVAGCVLTRSSDKEKVRTLSINGLDKKNVALMRTWEKRPPECDLVEVMCCEGGCIAGPGTITKPAVAMRLRGKE